MTTRNPSQAPDGLAGGERVQPDGPLSGEVQRGGFTFDTSGDVMIPIMSEILPGTRFAKWSDLSPFERGYIAAAIGSAEMPALPWNREAWRFSDLAPATLAGMLKDCEAWCSRLTRGSDVVMRQCGQQFWRERNGSAGLDGFPPQTLSLSPEGQVIAEVDQ